jgi:hypothetical protein
MASYFYISDIQQAYLHRFLVAFFALHFLAQQFSVAHPKERLKYAMAFLTSLRMTSQYN